MSAEDQQRIEQQRQAYQTGLLNQAQAEEDGQQISMTFEHFTVSAIVNRNGQRLAIINGKTYPERTLKEGIHVHRIYEKSVTLTLEASQQWGRAQLGTTYSTAHWPNGVVSNIELKRLIP